MEILLMKPILIKRFHTLIREYEDNKQVNISGTLEDYIYLYLKYGERDADINYIIKNLTGNEKTLFISLLSICDELRKYNIDTPEILNTDNWGIKPNGALGLFDIGFGNWFEAFNEEPKELNIDEATDENIQVFTDIAQKVAKKLNHSDLKYLGAGFNGFAFEVNDNTVLKITKDKSEAVNSQKIVGDKLNYVADIYKIFSLQIGVGTFYVIILEKLDRSKIENTLKTLNKLKKWFTTVKNKHIDPTIISMIANKHPKVAGFMTDLMNMGYTTAWAKWKSKLIRDNKYDWNDISDVVEWIKGSKTNNNDVGTNPPQGIHNTISKLVR